jgi:translation elongation factor EF-4
MITTLRALQHPITKSLFQTQVRLEMMTPTEYTGALMDLGQTRRGIFVEMKYLTPERSTLIYEVRILRLPPARCAVVSLE